MRTWGPNDDKPLVDAILDSAAVPFLFRTPTDQDGMLADGGICENLPAGELRDFIKQDGPILALSFSPQEQSRGTPDSIFSYGIALASAAIDHSVRRAKQDLGDRVLELEFPVDSFDFQAAWKDGFLLYDGVRRHATDFFQRHAAVRQSESERSVSQDVWRASATSLNAWEQQYLGVMSESQQAASGEPVAAGWSETSSSV